MGLTWQILLTFKIESSEHIGEDMEKRELLCTTCWNVNWYYHYGKQYGGFLKKIKKRTTIWSSNSISGYSPEEIKNTNMSTHVHGNFIYNSKDMEKPKCPLTEE